MDKLRAGRRFKVMAVADDNLLSLLNGKIRLIDLDLPEDTRVVDVYRDYERLCTCLVLESAFFPSVPFGHVLEHLPPLQVRYD